MPQPLTPGPDPVRSLRAPRDEGRGNAASRRPRLLDGSAILVAALVLVAGACLGAAGFAAEQHYRHWLPKPVREGEGWRVVVQHGRRFSGLSLSGAHLTWQDGPLILLMDLASGRVRVLGPGADNKSTWRPAVSGRYVVWFEGRSAGSARGEAYAYDLDSRRRRAVAPAVRPASYAAVSGRRAVWTETTESSGAVLKVLDVRTGALLGISSRGGEPVVDGSLVAMKRAGSGGDSVSALDLRTRREWQVVAANGEMMTGFAVSGRRVAWGWADGTGGPGRVLTRHVDTGATALLAEASGLTGPAIDGDLVVWAEVASGGSVIMGCRPDGGAAFEIASTAGRVETVQVSGSTVAWLERGSGPASVIQTVSVHP